MSAYGNGRTPAPSMTLEAAEAELQAAINDLPDVELALYVRWAVITQQGQQAMHARLAPARLLGPITPAIRVAIAASMREAADLVEADVELVGVPFRCPACGKRELVPEAELALATNLGGTRTDRQCEGRLRRHPPAFLLPDHPRPSTRV